jgi:ATP-binding cassette subfamily B protein
MQAIDGLSDDLTVLIIAHRLTTLRNCSQIVELGDGGIRRIAPYSEIQAVQSSTSAESPSA